MNDFSPKKVLICQNSLVNIAGSEVVTLELAEYFKSKGVEVTIYTIYIDSPMRELFSEFNVLLPDSFDHKVDEYDLIWVHQHVLPESIIRSLVKGHEYKTKFVFFHMSAFLDFEMPYVYELEKNLPSLSLWVSEETKESYRKYVDSRIIEDGLLFQNPSPESFFQSQKINIESPPKRLVIVTNHPCEEVQEALNLLEEKGVEIHRVGSEFEPIRIDQEALQNIDVIISIGKTVQYGLAMGIPTYVYDHFGGPGYLNSENFDLALWHNFSGRGFGKKSGEEIAQEVIDFHGEAATFIKTMSDVINYKFSLDVCIARVLDSFNRESKKSDLDVSYIEYLSLKQRMIVDYVTRIHTYNHIVDYLKGMSSELAVCKDANLDLNRRVEEYKNRKIVRLMDKFRNLISFKR